MWDLMMTVAFNFLWAGSKEDQGKFILNMRYDQQLLPVNDYVIIKNEEISTTVIFEQYI